MPDITEQGPAYSLLDAKIRTASGSTIIKTDLFYARTIAVDPQLQTLTFEGDDTSQLIDDLTRIDITVTCDKQDWDAVQTIFDKTKVDPSDTDEEWRMYFGDDAEISGAHVGLQYDVKYKDESVTPYVAATIRWIFHSGTLKVMRPQQAEWKAKQTLVLNFSFEKTTVDVAGVALDGVPASGTYYSVSRLA